MSALSDRIAHLRIALAAIEARQRDPSVSLADKHALSDDWETLYIELDELRDRYELLTYDPAEDEAIDEELGGYEHAESRAPSIPRSHEGPSAIGAGAPPDYEDEEEDETCGPNCRGCFDCAGSDAPDECYDGDEI